MENPGTGIGIGNVVSTIGWLARGKGVWVEENKVKEAIIKRFEVTEEVAQLDIQMSERCNAVERKNGKIRVKKLNKEVIR